MKKIKIQSIKSSYSNKKIGLITLFFISISWISAFSLDISKTPYPIIFVHGLNSNDATWNDAKDFLKTNYGLSYGGRMDFCLNQDGNFVTSKLADDYKDYTNIDDSHRIVNGDFYTINFDVNNFGIPYNNNVLSNQSAIVKQGKAVSDAIKHVLQITGKDKVILVGHSMGGLASREYLQNKYLWYEPNINHHVAKLCTLGTPHGGSDSPASAAVFEGVDAFSEAVRDLKTKSEFLNGGSEAEIITRVLMGYYNGDVNCNGTENDQINGLNQLSYPENLPYSCVVGIGDLLGGDGVVSTWNANINNFLSVKADVFYLPKTSGITWHTELPNQLQGIMQVLDEPSDPAFAYQISENSWTQGAITPQPNSQNVDIDFFKIVISKRGKLVTNVISLLETGLYSLEVLDANQNIVSSTAIDNTNSLSTMLSNQLAAGTYFIRLFGMASGESYKSPYSINSRFTPDPVINLNNTLVNSGMDIYSGSVDYPKSAEITFTKTGIVNGTQIINLKINNRSISGYSVSNQTYNSVTGKGAFTLLLTTNALTAVGITENGSYDISFDVYNSENNFYGSKQLYFISPSSFTDIKTNDWCRKDITIGLNLGLYKGSSTTWFGKSDNLTMAQAAKVIVNTAIKLGLIDVNTSTQNGTFSDVPESHWSFPYVQTLRNYGYISANTNFNPDQCITAGEFSKMLCKTLSLTSNEINENNVNKGNGRLGSRIKISSANYQEYLDILSKIVVVSDDANGARYVKSLAEGLRTIEKEELNSSKITFNGDNYISRAIMAKVIANAYIYRKQHTVMKVSQAVVSKVNTDIYNVSNYSIIGNNFELTSNTSGNTPQYAQDITALNSGQTIILGSKSEFFDGVICDFYWVADGGQLVDLFPDNNHREISFTAPQVAALTIVKLYLTLSSGTGQTLYVTYNMLVFPSGSETYYSISSPVNPSDGGSVNGTGAFTNGQSCTLTANANYGYSFVNWTENGSVISTDKTYTFNVNSNRVITANFTAVNYYFSIFPEISPAEGGTITGTGTYLKGTVVPLVAVANPGFEFKGWTWSGSLSYPPSGSDPEGNGYRNENPAFSYEAEMGNLTAYFVKIKPVISATTIPEIGGTVTGGGTYVYGDLVKMIATANSGYYFKNWTVNGIIVSTNPNYNFAAEQHTTLVANFKINPVISASTMPENGGTVTGGGSYVYGGSVNMVATANSGFLFKNWTVNGIIVSTNPNFSFVAEQDTMLVANFKLALLSTNLPVTSITPYKATLKGVIRLGEETVTSYGFCCNTIGSPTIEDSKIENVTQCTGGKYSNTMTDLTAATTYYIRSFATDIDGTVYGAEVSFEPAVIPATSIVGGNYFVSQYWPLSKSPYTISNNVNLAEGMTLTIEPGVVVNFAGAYEIMTMGHIIADGTATNNITFNANNNQCTFFDFKNTNLSDTHLSYLKLNGYMVKPVNPWDALTVSKAVITQGTCSDTISLTNVTMQNAALFNKIPLVITNSNLISLYAITQGTDNNLSNIIIQNSTLKSSDFGSQYEGGSIKINNSIGSNLNFTNQGGMSTSQVEISNSKITNSNINVRMINYFSLSNTTLNVCTINIMTPPNSTNATFIKKTKINNSNITISNWWDNLDLKLDSTVINNSSLTLGSGNSIVTNCIFKTDSTQTLNLNGTITKSQFIGNNNKLGGVGLDAISGTITSSTIVNHRIGLQTGTLTINNSNLINHSQYAIINTGANAIDAKSNYWGVGATTTATIKAEIFDYYKDLNLGKVAYDNYLSVPNVDCPITPPQNFKKSVGSSGVNYSWNANPETDVKGYKLYYGNFDGFTFAHSIDVGNVTNYNLPTTSINDTVLVTAYDLMADGKDDMIKGHESWYSYDVIQPGTISAVSNNLSGGVVSGAGVFEIGKLCTLLATPNSGFIFANWTENGTPVSTSASYSFMVSGNRDLVANFTPKPSYLISVSPAIGGTTSGGGLYEVDKLCTVTATPNTGYTFVNWTENGTQVSTSTSYSFTVSANRNLVANFSVSYMISTSSNPAIGGATSGGGSLPSGTTQTVVATPNSGYTFVNWTENGTQVSTAASYSFTVGANRNLVANFTQQVNYTIVLTLSGGGGTLSGGGTVIGGTIQTVVATPISGFIFVNWTENNRYISSSASYTFEVSSNRNLRANFTPSATSTPIRLSSPLDFGATTLTMNKSYNFSASVINSSTLAWSGVVSLINAGVTILSWNQTIPAGTSTQFTGVWMPATIGSKPMTLSYQTGGVGTAMQFLSSYGITNPITLTVISSGSDGYRISAGVNPSASGTVTGAALLQNGQSCTLSATPNSGYLFTSWTENGGVISTNSVISFKVSSNRNIVANFNIMTGLEETIEQKTSLQLYPNPANTHLRISTKEVLHRLEVCDISGRVIQYETVNSDSHSLNVSHLAKGIYIIKGFTYKGVVTSRFIKE
ncbi:MAG: alpha/beta fold hydrolase [Paludibacter sp.]